ncbi:hypothetical protein ASE59_10115 [Sphingomonas sp. Leaf10]|nr:hypothetical protein ASE59_10115 [Sphingomonas sp. Leaf10]
MRHLLLALFLLATPALAQTPPPANNAEMAKLFAEDQAIRENVPHAKMQDMAFVEKMWADDAARRTRTRALLESGQLSTADDYYAAAFVFQHGEQPQDYLLAHSLALAAVARGKAKASWIAAATLDRYLQNIGQKQVYGTQWRWPNDALPSREPYDRQLIPDSLRTALGVPTLAKQDKNLAEMQAEQAATK